MIVFAVISMFGRVKSARGRGVSGKRGRRRELLRVPGPRPLQQPLDLCPVLGELGVALGEFVDRCAGRGAIGAEQAPLS